MIHCNYMALFYLNKLKFIWLVTLTGNYVVVCQNALYKFKLVINDHFVVPENIHTPQSYLFQFKSPPQVFSFPWDLMVLPWNFLQLIFFYLGPARLTHSKFNICKIMTLTLFLFISYSAGTEIFSCSCLWLYCR